VLVDAKHGDHSHFELVVARVTLEDGSEGVGYTYTGGKGGRAIWELIEHDLKPSLLGKDAGRIEQLWDHMEWHIHYVARGGCASFAISAVDIALWDLKCKRAGEPLWRMAGGYSNSTKCYAGGIDLAYSLEKLLSNIRHYLAQGHTAVKIKLGQPTLSEDLARVKAVRELIGADRTFMVDANMKWTVETSIRAARALQKFDVLWLEEPTIPDDFAGYDRIRSEGGLAIAQGENLHTLHEFQHALSRGKVDFPQPDASNIGGITGWLKVANLAQAYNLPVSSHGMQELHVSLMSAVPNQGWMEVHSFPIDEYTMRPLAPHIQDGRASAPDTPGTGVEFDFEKLRPYRVR
jgi:L-alanine-DL-glutamate epimerase-like enolase superfamily enzyme